MPVLTVKCNQTGKSRLQEFPSACCRTLDFVHFFPHFPKAFIKKKTKGILEILNFLFFFLVGKETKVNIHKERKAPTQILLGFVLG